MNAIRKWKENEELNPELKAELDAMTESELQEAFYKHLEFGTAGMRGIIGPGTNRINVYTLRKASYGYGKYLLNKYSRPAVVIAYDTRHKSREFADECAKVLGGMKIKVHLFPKPTPTPELSFAVRHLQAQGGIVITASHNPPKFNGCKFYDEYGCQLVPELVEEVLEELAQAPDAFAIPVGDFEGLLSEGCINLLGEEVDEAYLSEVKKVAVNPKLRKEDFRLVFTPLHGTAALPGEKLLHDFGYAYVTVAEQMTPDPEFRTVRYPNPEDPDAFRLAIEYGKRSGADILLATDPDADRIGVAVFDGRDYVLLSGNQTGAILLHYLISEKKPKKNAVVFKSIVTSDLGEKIARAAGLEVVSTLTGFKYIGDQIRLLENTDKEFFFGYEESFGYVIKPFVRDKDSLQALVVCAEAANFYKLQGMTLLDVLEEIQREYGYHADAVVNLEFAGKAGAERIQAIMESFRNNRFTHFGSVNIKAAEDYLKRIRLCGNERTPLTLSASDVLKFYLEDGSWVVLRPSGTEPKLKIYFAAASPNKDEAENRIKELQAEILSMIEKVG
ncbi:MAG TPA: phospho-sugar mutase [Acholeplasmataceae bacterium]|nr:phospho-sugar mutase [Acholeplasmataceae bacterium]